MKNRMIFISLGFLFLFVFYLFSWQVKKERFKQINFDTTVRLQDKMPKRLDSYWEDITFFVEPIPSIVLVGLLTVVAFVDIKKKKLRPAALIIPLLFGMVVATEIYGKAKVESPAPPFFMLKNPTMMFPKFHIQEQYSYPSGHAARSLFLAIIALYIARRYVKNYQQLSLFAACSLWFVAFISVGKVYLGQHWLSDILGGYVLALAFGSFAGVFLWEQGALVQTIKQAINRYPRPSKRKQLADALDDA
jgi:undecaprenyl-diphosphatase